MNLPLFFKYKKIGVLITFVLFSSLGWGQATLPFSYDLGKPTSITGLTHSNLGADYTSSPKMKFDNAGDYLILNFSSQPQTL